MPKSRFTSKVSPQIMSEDVESLNGDSTVSMNADGMDDTLTTIPQENSITDMDTVSFNTEYKETAPVKMVKVRLNCNHRCSFGGEWWDFEKGKTVNVPAELKKTLLEAGLLMPM